MRALLAWLCAGLAIVPAGAAGDTFVDAALGSVDARVVTASEIALARALAVFGFAPSAAPIDAGDVDRMLDAVLVVQEAEQLDIGGGPDEAEAAWRAASERFGGPPALERWLADANVEPAWARALVASDARWRRFIDARFREFAFVMPDDVAAALGPGAHDAAAVERARARLRAEQTARQLEAWLRETRERVGVRRLLADDARIPLPFSMPASRP
jgi:hypothetical protein